MRWATRRVALVTMLVAVGALTISITTRDSAASDEAAEAAAPVAVLPLTPTPNPFTVTTTDEVIMLSRLWSPLANTARAEGTMSIDQLPVTVTVDGVAAVDVVLVAGAGGGFTVDIAGLPPGPQELCLADACQRVLVLDPSLEDRAVIEDRIADAISLVRNRLDVDGLLPGWTITVAGPNSSSGGSTLSEARSISINANSGRSLEDYQITVLHEIAHGVDAEWMDDLRRAEFRAMRGHDPTLVWGPVAEFTAGDERWRNSAEDFAEVFVAWALDNDYAIMTTVVAPQPSAADLLAFCELIGAEPLNCG